MNLNPFDLRGPEFLAFYACLVTGIAILLLIMRYRMESGTSIQEDSLVNEIARDPYQIAYLRGGKNEVIRMAIVSLLDRQWILAKKNNLVRIRKGEFYHNQHPLDKAIITRLSNEELPAQSLFSDRVIVSEAEMIGNALRQKKLLPDSDIRWFRTLACTLATIFLWGVAAAKIGIALSRGRTNIIFLVLMAIFVPFFVIILLCQTQTVLGWKVVKKLQNLFSDIQNRLKYQSITPSSELVFLAAAFGIAALPNHITETLDPLHLYPEGRQSKGGGDGSGCGSSSSCSGGSSCGGGGCGGGCGGCGG